MKLIIGFLFGCILLIGLCQAHMILNAYKLPFEDKNNNDRNEKDLLVRKISSGLIQGRKLITPSNVEGYVFLSIPIAENPIGELRFRAPIPRKKWSGILDATNYTVSCFWDSIHTSYAATDFDMSEDCIQVNVFTNRKCLTDGNCAVAMYVHGGVFEFGTPLQYRQDFIVDNFNNVTRNVVFVSVGYRQAFLGVANFNHKFNLSMDMNAGFHDLIHALKWIKSEISTFGGNPNRVTVMGHSGGGGMTKTLAMSPKAKYMINQMIAMSQSSDYALVKDKNQAASRAAAKEVGCANFNPSDKKWDSFNEVEKVIKCLRTKSAKELTAVQPIIEEKGYQFRYAAQDSGENAVLPRTYSELFHEMIPTPILTGSVSKEYQDSKEALIKLANGSFIIDKNGLQKWAKKALVKVEYLNPDNRTIYLTEKEYSTPERVVQIYDDVEIYVPTFNLALHQTLKGANSFLYEYIYPNIGKAYDRGPYMAPIDKRESPHHAQELAYLLGQHAGTFTEKDHQIKFLYSQFFVNFINHGTPVTPSQKWHPLDPERQNYFVIDFPDPDLKSPGERNGYHSKAVKFWDYIIPRIAGPKSIITKESQLPYDPIPIKNKNNEALFLTPVLNGTGIEHIGENNTKVENAIFLTKTTTTEEYLEYRRHGKNNHKGINWMIMFWIGFGIIILLAISHILTCVKLKSKKDEYQHI
jgi:carboxylesterase type B